ncbi:MAG: AAA family ATPase [Deltaproteobacteria bacterium]|nr:AAA family ATPase [Deltaproteobacteria bacterium]
MENVDIALSDNERKHLILTGKNGSGKTSLLEAMRNDIFLKQINTPIKQWPSAFGHNPQWARLLLLGGKKSMPAIEIMYSAPIRDFLNVTFAYISAARTIPEIPKAVEAVEIYGKNIVSRNTSKDFLKYILILYVQYLSAKESGDSASDIAKYSTWLENFTNALREIYDCQELKLKADMKSLTFQVIMPGREQFRLHEMSDGYAAFIEIYMELLMRLEKSDAVVEYANPAIVLIDEIETHLHVELQKRALPFLTKSFPNVQFIVTTHSPFVISSRADAIVYDLDKHVRLEDASLYSYDEIIEGFYDLDNVSIKALAVFERYKMLCESRELSDTENDEIIELRTRLKQVSPANKSLYLAFATYEQGRKK